MSADERAGRNGVVERRRSIDIVEWQLFGSHDEDVVLVLTSSKSGRLVMVSTIPLSLMEGAVTSLSVGF
jgi:hypothetical protein